jgi:hypothetical protein
MTERNPPAGDDVFHTWTNAERDVWNAWSKGDQDVSEPDSAHAGHDMLDAMEASAVQVAKLQTALVRGASGSLQANPLLPPSARPLVEQSLKPLLSLSGWQQHLVSAWFGMARHAAMSVPHAQHPNPRH